KSSSLKDVLKTSLPAVVDLSSQTIAWLIEAIFIGNISAAALAGVGLSLQMIILTFTVVLTFVVGASIIIVRYLGAGDRWNANHVLAQALILGTILAFLISALWYFGGTQVFRLISEESPRARLYGIQYMQTISYFGPLLIVNFIALGILRMAGDTLITMRINLMANTIHLFLSYGLVFGKFGLPRMESVGAALAVGIAHSIAFFVTIYVLRSRRCSLFLSISEFIHPNFETFKRLYRLGLPTTIEQLVWAFGQLVLSFYAGYLGVVVLATHQIFVRIQSVLTMAFQGFGLASMSLVGKSIGANEHQEAQKAGFVTGGVALVAAIVAGVLLKVFQDSWMGIFTNDADVVRYGTSLVWVLVLIQIPKAMNIVFTGNLRGGADLKWLMWLAISSVLIFEITGAYILTFVFQMALTGIWAIQGVDETMRLASNIWRFRQTKWAGKSIL
ncbi:MAG: MATE family efflux transporter, partial [Calditrichaeota bacterium]|nr:MATE family efflux transporter [Calditrichota bacterium]